ncbi:MAG: ABC-2 transporter permease [Oscillospiraceae bacterium]|nr:ABC-2 transporter permease [Oscillospiraceae bacterium]
MKALLRKEFYLLGGYKYLLTMFIAPFALLLWMKFIHCEAEIFCPIISIVIGFPLGLLPDITDRLEAQSRWRTYAKALPYSRADKVNAKYVFSLLAALTGSVLTFLPMLLLHCSAYRVTTGASITLVTVLNTSAFLYPLIFRRIRRGSGFLYHLIAALLGIVYFLPQCSLLVAFCTASAQSSIKAPPQLLMYMPYIAVPVSLVIYLLSWRLTCRIYGCRFPAAPQNPRTGKDSDEDAIAVMQMMFWN